MASVTPGLPELIAVAGLPSTLALVEHFGGTRVYLPHPRRVNPRGKLAAAIGLESAQKLSAAWPQEIVEIPRAAAYMRRRRDAAICLDRKRLSVREVALKYRMTERNVLRILRASKGLP